MTGRFCTLAAVALLACALAPARALAHVPTLEPATPSGAIGATSTPYPQATRLPSPDISRAIYGYLAKGQQRDAYAFEVDKPVTTTVELIVPKRVGLEGFRPTLQIYETTQRRIVAEQSGGSGKRASFFEPFSVASFWKGPTATVTFTPGERYYLVVGSGSGEVTHGPYVVAFGGAERFSAGDWLDSARVLPVIWLGSWSGGPQRPGATACCVALVALAIVVVVALVRRIARRRDAAV